MSADHPTGALTLPRPDGVPVPPSPSSPGPGEAAGPGGPGGRRTRVAVLFGGPSSEHDVSCASAAAVVQHLDPARYDVVPVRVTREGAWVVGRRDESVADVDVPALVTMTAGTPTGSVAESVAAAAAELSGVDVALPAFHGPYGEDGRVQALLDLLAIPYVGSGVASSAVGMDKEWTKHLLTAAGYRVAAGAVLRGTADTLTDAEKERLGLPVFVKPSRDGSSIGVSRVSAWDQLADAVAYARGSDDKVLVEEAVAGREVDIGVLEHPDGRLEAGPPLEILLGPAGVWFDHAAKYTSGAADLNVPADLDPATTQRLQAMAVEIFRTLDCRGLLRVDFFLPEDGPPVVNEVNTFPGFTALSQYPRMWQAAGISYSQLLDVLLETALRAGAGRGADVA